MSIKSFIYQDGENTQYREENKDVRDLIKKVQDGDKKSFEQLFKRYEKAILNLIKVKVFKTFQDESLDDFSQDIWERVYLNINKYDPAIASFYTWVRKIACNHIINYYIKHRSKLKLDRLLEEDINKEYFWGYTESSFDPENRILQFDLYNKIFKITLLEGGAPHQSLTTCLTKFLSGWNPKNVVNELSDHIIEKITETLKMDVEKVFKKEILIFSDIFNNFKIKIKMKVKYVLEPGTPQEKYVLILEKQAGNTKLKDYYGKNPEHNIADWSDKVKNRVIRIFKEKFIDPQ